MVKKPNRFLEALANTYIKLIDKRLKKCPIKKSKYVFLEGRDRDFVNTSNLTDGFPMFIPLKGRYVLRTTARTTLNKKPVNLYSTYEVFDVVSD